MQDRRQTTRDKVIYGGVAEIGETGTAKECVVRNISEKGASIEFGERRQISQTTDIADHRPERPFLPRQGHLVARQFRRRSLSARKRPPNPPVSDLDERLRKSVAKKHAAAAPYNRRDGFRDVNPFSPDTHARLAIPTSAGTDTDLLRADTSAQGFRDPKQASRSRTAMS